MECVPGDSPVNWRQGILNLIELHQIWQHWIDSGPEPAYYGFVYRDVDVVMVRRIFLYYRNFVRGSTVTGGFSPQVIDERVESPVCELSLLMTGPLRWESTVWSCDPFMITLRDGQQGVILMFVYCNISYKIWIDFSGCFSFHYISRWQGILVIYLPIFSRLCFYQTRSAWSVDQGSNKNHSPAYNFAPTVTKFCVMWEGLSLPHGTKFGNCRCKIVDSRAFPSWSLIHGLRWSGLIKAEPGLHHWYCAWLPQSQLSDPEGYVDMFRVAWFCFVIGH